MNWFVVRIVFQIIIGNREHTAQFDEQLKLISAEDEKSAFGKASLMGNSGQDSFLNSAGEKVEWKFTGISELTKINGLEDGIELYSRIIETDNADNYVYFIQQNNQDIESRLIPLKANAVIC